MDEKTTRALFNPGVDEVGPLLFAGVAPVELAAHFFFDHFAGAGCVACAVVPVDLDGGHVAAGGEFIGDVQLFGRDNVRSIELALDDRGGELLGHPIDLKTEDSLCSKEGGTTAASKIVADPQIVAIIGPTCSGAAASAMEVVSDAGLVMISGSSSAPSLTSVGGERGSDWQPGFLRTAQNDALSGRAAATFAFEELGVTRAATINDGDPYTRGLTDTFEEAFTELGGEVVLAAGVNKGDSNMHPVLTAVATSGAELVFFPAKHSNVFFFHQSGKTIGKKN